MINREKPKSKKDIEEMLSRLKGEVVVLLRQKAELEVKGRNYINVYKKPAKIVIYKRGK